MKKLFLLFLLMTTVITHEIYGFWGLERLFETKVPFIERRTYNSGKERFHIRYAKEERHMLSLEADPDNSNTEEFINKQVPDGLVYEYEYLKDDTDGHKKYEMNYKDHQQTGTTNVYDNSGNLIGIQNYVNGTKNGIEIHLFNHISKQDTYSNLSSKTYLQAHTDQLHPSLYGSPIESVENYVNGEVTGLQLSFYESGNIKSVTLNNQPTFNYTESYKDSDRFRLLKISDAQELINTLMQKALLDKEKELEDDNNHSRIEIYKDLISCDPGNSEYKSRYQDLVAKDKLVKIQSLLDDEKKLDKNDNANRVELYKKLISYDPDNTKYKERHQYFLAQETAAKIKALLIKEKSLDKNDNTGRMNLYKELMSYDPDNVLYKKKYQRYRTYVQAAETERRARRAQLIESLGMNIKSYWDYDKFCQELGEPSDKGGTYSHGIYGSGGNVTWTIKENTVTVYFGRNDFVRMILVNGNYLRSFD